MNIAIIFAGGAGRRMNTVSRPKQFVMLAQTYTPLWLRKLLFKRTTNYNGDFCAE